MLAYSDAKDFKEKVSKNWQSTHLVDKKVTLKHLMIKKNVLMVVTGFCKVMTASDEMSLAHVSANSYCWSS